MDSFLKAAQKQAALLGEELQKHADNIQQNASLLGEPLFGASAGRSEYTFQDGPLGFVLDGTVVATVTPGGQAERHGVQVGDRLVCVDGYAVPLPRSATDVAGEKRARALAKQWLEDMPRPSSLIFRSVAPEGTAGEEGDGVDGIAESLEASSLLASDEVPAAAPVRTAAAAPRAAQSAAGAQGAPGPSSGAPATASAAPGQAATVAEERVRAELGRVREALRRSETELYVAREQIRGLEADIEEVRQDRRSLLHVVAESDEGVGTAQSQLEVQARRLQDQLNGKRAEAEAAHREISEVQARLASSRSECEGLRAALVQSEEAQGADERERERVLGDEISRLHGALTTTELESKALLRAAGAAAEARVAELEEGLAHKAREAREAASRAGAAEAATDRVLRDAFEKHALAFERLREEHAESTSALQLQARQVARDLEAARRALAAAEAPRRPPSPRGPAKATPAGGVDEDDRCSNAGSDPGALEGGTGGVQASDAASAATPEVAAMQERLDTLERRCLSLQKKLNARPIVCQAFAPAALAAAQAASSASAGRAGALLWEPPLRATLGPNASAVVIRLHAQADGALRRFTQGLLRNSGWLWLFYAHLVVLYAIATSSYAQAANGQAASVDALASNTVQQPSP